MIKIKLQLFTLGTNTMDAGTDSVALARQQLYDNFTRMGFGPTSDGITTIGEANKTVKTDEKGDIYERGNRVAEDFKTGRVVPSVFLNGTNAYMSVTNNANLNFGTGTFSIITEQLFESGAATRYKIYKRVTVPGFQIAHNEQNKLYISVSDGTNTVALTSTNTITDGNLHKIGFILGWDMATTKLVIDGIEDTTVLKTGTIPTLSKDNVANLLIGSAAGVFYKNEVRNTQIFNYALTVENCRKYMYESLPYSEIGASNTDMLAGNGLFTTDTTAYFSKANGTLTWNSGTQDETFVASGLANDSYISKGGVYTVGKRYRITFKAKSTNSTAIPSPAASNIVTSSIAPPLTTTYQNYTFETLQNTALLVIVPFASLGSASANGLDCTIDDLVIIQIGNVLDLSPDSITNTAWYDKSGNGMIANYTNALPQNLNNYKPRVMNYSVDMRGANVASATTITPSGELFHVTGTTAIATINVPFVGFNGSITIIPDGIFTWTTAGNIALAGTAVVNKALTMTYDATTSKWYPSY